MMHSERKLAKRFDAPGRCRRATEIVYGGESEDKAAFHAAMAEATKQFKPEPPEYQVFFGELHGHTALSDGKGTEDDFFIAVRDKAKLDFAALTDHDHGGVGNAELWGAKWEQIKAAVKKYNDPGKFTTILAYERDSYPWYNNMIVYYNDHEGEMLRGEQDGEITREELHAWLSREDLLLIPHDTATLGWGTDFFSLEQGDMTPLIQVYSRYNYSERRDPALMYDSDCEGGHWQDALERGARMGCVAGSDDHGGTNGRYLPDMRYPHNWPGVTGVWAKENTLPAIFEALKARRCYGSMGGRIVLDFRLNGHYMGEELSDADERVLYYKIEADEKIDTVTIVKNGRDYIVLQAKAEETVLDYRKERSTDYYYTRVRLADGRYAWSSPIWIG
ncbi:MAG: DUF3604 domain-containing protein [Clostridia bacterium]|nr:DUF3604 domain-containing protein [Clostridia bacterium]